MAETVQLRDMTEAERLKEEEKELNCMFLELDKLSASLNNLGALWRSRKAGLRPTATITVTVPSQHKTLALYGIQQLGIGGLRAVDTTGKD